MGKRCRWVVKSPLTMAQAQALVDCYDDYVDAVRAEYEAKIAAIKAKHQWGDAGTISFNRSQGLAKCLRGLGVELKGSQ